MAAIFYFSVSAGKAAKAQKRWVETSLMTNFTSGTTPSGAAVSVRRTEADCCFAWPASSRWLKVTTLRWEIWWMCSVESLAWTHLVQSTLSDLLAIVILAHCDYEEPANVYGALRSVPLISLSAHVNYIYLPCHPHSGCEKVLRPVWHQRGAEVFPGGHEGAAPPGPPSGPAFNGLSARWEALMITEWDLLEWKEPCGFVSLLPIWSAVLVLKTDKSSFRNAPRRSLNK